jgi:hypothetical protein
MRRVTGLAKAFANLNMILSDRDGTNEAKSLAKKKKNQ